VVVREEAALRRPAHRCCRLPRDDHSGRWLRADLRFSRDRDYSWGRLLLRDLAESRLHWDDALDVWGVHGVGGLLGIVLLGVFAGTAINPNGAQGLVHGSATFFAKQVAPASAARPTRSASPT
jgi:hypothetical protein